MALDVENGVLGTGGIGNYICLFSPRRKEKHRSKVEELLNWSGYMGEEYQLIAFGRESLARVLETIFLEENLIVFDDILKALGDIVPSGCLVGNRVYSIDDDKHRDQGD